MEIAELSNIRQGFLQTSTEDRQMVQTEESKHEACFIDIHHVVEILTRQTGATAYMNELWVAFSKARSIELEMKAKAAESQKQE